MTELDNVSLYLYSMTSKGVNVKKELIKYGSKIFKLRSLKKDKLKGISGIENKKDPAKVLILKNLNLFINKGERIGLIGCNGSGKSTLLKLMSGIYSPSSGKINGDLFFPMIIRDLNVSHDLTAFDASKAFFYQHNLKKLGYSMNQFINEIEISCKIGNYFTKPIKYYSEGMRTRLIFSLLTSVRLSENLAIDEGFGTGDKLFASNAEVKLNNFLGSMGSLLLASHSDDLLRQFCQRGWVMKYGQILFDGNIEEALAYYASKEYLSA